MLRPFGNFAESSYSKGLASVRDAVMVQDVLDRTSVLESATLSRGFSLVHISNSATAEFALSQKPRFCSCKSVTGQVATMSCTGCTRNA
jgi:hypothetical protein